MVFAQVKKCIFVFGLGYLLATISAMTTLIWPNVLSQELWAIALYSDVAVKFVP